jgi:hypothetical protein
MLGSYSRERTPPFSQNSGIEVLWTGDGLSIKYRTLRVNNQSIVHQQKFMAATPIRFATADRPATRLLSVRVDFFRARFGIIAIPARRREKLSPPANNGGQPMALHIKTI